MEPISLDIHERRKILIQMLDYSSFGSDNRQANLLWLVEDINHLIRVLGMQGEVIFNPQRPHDLSHLPNTTSDSRD